MFVSPADSSETGSYVAICQLAFLIMLLPSRSVGYGNLQNKNRNFFNYFKFEVPFLSLYTYYIKYTAICLDELLF